MSLKRTDADVDPDEIEDEVLDDDDDKDEELDAIARKAARQASKQDPDEDDEKDDTRDAKDDDENLASDEEVRQWLESVVATPEIRKIIRTAAREIAAKSTNQAVSDVKDQLTRDFEKRLERVAQRFEQGKLTQDQADEKAKEAAEAAAASAAKKAEGDEPPAVEPPTPPTPVPAVAEEDERRRQEDEKREAASRKKEVELYRREVLLDEDRTLIIPEMIMVRDGTSEDDVDEMIEMSKDVRSRIRKDVIRELRAKGWKSPNDLSSKKDEDEEDEEPSRPPTGPPGRDARADSLSPERKRSLRERFHYADPERVGSGRRR